ncbi:Uncharacterised protein [Mycobacteroides abscessus subsp. abscessus]|nr:Uncharacterised protein [Mycobacteroides abscessus subsp. abscessus]
MKLLFLLLSLLNFFDGIFTFLGIKLNHISEANPLMNYLWEISPFLFLLLKVALSFFLVYLAISFSSKNIRLWVFLLSIPLMLYSSILLLHIVWITKTFS